MAQTHISRRSCSARFLAVVGRCLLCLCLWNSPLPLLHAHPGAAREEASELAEHLQECHWRYGADGCACWHMHLVLWGEVQADHPASDPAPPQPRPVDDSAVPSAESATRHLADAEQLLMDQFEVSGLGRCDLICSQAMAPPSARSRLAKFGGPIARMTVIRC